MSLNRRMKRQLAKEQRRMGEEHVKVSVNNSGAAPFGISKPGYNAIYQAGYEAGLKAGKEDLVPYYAKYFTYQILAVCCKILMENYSLIHVRKTRLEKFLELYARGLEMLGDDKSTEQYEKYIEHFGIKANWKELDKNEINDR